MSLWNVLKGKINDNESRNLRLDSATHTLQCITYEHHEIHNGSHFMIEDVENLATNNVFDVQFITPNTTKWIHFDFVLTCENQTEWYIYEGSTINTSGTVLTPINNDRNSVKISTTSILAIKNTTVVNANLDTDVSTSKTIAHGLIGSGKDGGIINRDDEIILKQNTIYCMRAIANTAGYINFLMKWYEHTNKG